MTQTSVTLLRKSALGLIAAATTMTFFSQYASAAIPPGAAGEATYRAADCAPPPQTPPPAYGVPLPPGGGLFDSSNLPTGPAVTPPAVIGTATTEFIVLTGQSAANQRGFGGTTSAARLSQDPGGTAGLVLSQFNYAGTPGTNQNNLRGVFIWYRGNARAARNTSVNFCLQRQNGTGDVISYSTPLSEVPTTDLGDGWTQAFLGADPDGGGNFGGLRAGRMVVRKLTFTTTNQNNSNTITIGNIIFSTVFGSFAPVNINLDPANCGNLFTCPAGADNGGGGGVEARVTGGTGSAAAASSSSGAGGNASASRFTR